MRASPWVVAALVPAALCCGCRGGMPHFSPPSDDRIEETLFVLRLPPGDGDPEGELRPDGTLDRQAPLNEAEERQIRWLIAHLADPEESERLPVMRYLLRFDRRAEALILPMADHEDADIRREFAVVATILEMKGAVDSLRSNLRDDPDLLVRLESAGALAHFGHHEGTALLIDALDYPEPGIRLGAIYSLYHTYGTDRGFDPAGSDEARRPAVDRWRAWWAGARDRLPQ